MKRTKGICIFLVLTLSAVILVSLSTELFQDKEKNELSQSDVTKKTLPSSQIKEYQFVVVEESGNLVVYYVNQKIKYLLTMFLKIYQEREMSFRQSKWLF